MFKYILIVNGLPRSGKTTFGHILHEFMPVWSYSSVTKIKKMAMVCGWDETMKTEKDRKFLSDLKKVTTEYNDFVFNDLRRVVNQFYEQDQYKFLLIDIREPEEIERAVNQFGAKTVFIENYRAEEVTSNPSDARVREYNYDYKICNNASLEIFRKEIARFVAQLFWDTIM